MNDPTSAEREALAARLTGAIPAEPELSGLAARAEGGARRARRVRRTGVAGVAAAAVAAVVVIPQLGGSDRVAAGSGPPSSSPSSQTPPPRVCSTRPNHRDFTTGSGAWVTFCPARPQGHDALAALIPPPVPLTTDVGRLVAQWQRDSGFVHGCPFFFGATEFEVRVGFSDGTSTRIDGDTSYCQSGLTPGQPTLAGPSGFSVYDALVRSLGRQAASHYRGYYPPVPLRQCPTSLASPGRENVDGASAPLADSDMLLDLTAVEGLVCRYDAAGRLAGSTTAQSPEALRVASGASVLRRPPAPQGHTSRTSYLVTLRDKTDTWRTYTITGPEHALTFYRGTAPGTPEHLGYAGAVLLDLMHAPNG